MLESNHDSENDWGGSVQRKVSFSSDEVEPDGIVPSTRSAKLCPRIVDHRELMDETRPGGRPPQRLRDWVSV